MSIDVSYYSVSGLSNRRCAFLANRYDVEYGYKPGDAECWIAVNDYTVDAHGETRFTNGTLAWYTGLWSSPDGATYIARHDGWVIYNPDIFAHDAFSRWENHEFEKFSVWGVHGAGDEVMAWGNDTGNDTDAILAASGIMRRKGGEWSPMIAPGFRIVAMHGDNARNIWAAGAGGELGRWNGRSWKLHSGPNCPLHSIHVAGDVAYATNARGEVLRVAKSGVEVVAAVPGAMLPGDASCVAVWQGDLWVGSARLGLFRKAHSGLECIKSNLSCTSLDSREELVVCTANRISGTANGVDFKSFGVDVVRNGRQPFGLCKGLEGAQP